MILFYVPSVIKSTRSLACFLFCGMNKHTVIHVVDVRKRIKKNCRLTSWVLLKWSGSKIKNYAIETAGNENISDRAPPFDHLHMLS